MGDGMGGWYPGWCEWVVRMGGTGGQVRMLGMLLACKCRCPKGSQPWVPGHIAGAKCVAVSAAGGACALRCR